jgi:hypothetical protein
MIYSSYIIVVVLFYFGVVVAFIVFIIIFERIFVRSISFRTRESRRGDGNFVPNAGIAPGRREFRSERRGDGNFVPNAGICVQPTGLHNKTFERRPKQKLQQQTGSQVTPETRLLLS